MRLRIETKNVEDYFLQKSEAKGSRSAFFFQNCEPAGISHKGTNFCEVSLLIPANKKICWKNSTDFFSDPSNEQFEPTLAWLDNLRRAYEESDVQEGEIV